jgi:hypothetical protein
VVVLLVLGLLSEVQVVLQLDERQLVLVCLLVALMEVEVECLILPLLLLLLDVDMQVLEVYLSSQVLFLGYLGHARTVQLIHLLLLLQCLRNILLDHAQALDYL